MTKTPTFVKDAFTQGQFSWELISRAFRTEKRFEAVHPVMREVLVGTDLPFLPEVLSPDFLERDECSKAQIAGDPLSIYWADLRRIRPTSREEEFILNRAIHLLRDSLLDIVGHTTTPLTVAMLEEHLSPYSNVLEEARERPIDAYATLEEEIRLRLQRRLRELHDVQSALIDRNLHIVPTTARKYRHVGVPWEDLIQEGNTSLLRAVERYNREEGVRFASYASWWVQQGILKALSFQSRTVRLPVYLAHALHRVRDVMTNAEDTLTVEQIAEKTNLTPDRVERAQKADRQCLSLNRTPANDDEESGFADLLPDLRDIPLPDCPTSAELRAKLEQLLDRLPAREALVLRLRFGFEDGTPKTLEEVRIRLGVSRERVRQLQAQSLRRLARPAPKKELHKFV